MIIYKITNLFNEKIYIGQTTRTLEERITQHKYGNLKIDLAIRNYGMKFFKVEIVEECNNLEELNEREKYWIEYFNCKVPNGYNFTDGAKGNLNLTLKDKSVFQVIVDNKSGQIERYYPVRSKITKFPNENFHSEIAGWLAKQNLTNTQFKVILYLLSRLDFINFFSVNQKDIAEELKMKRPNVTRAMKALEQLEIIVEGPRAGLNKTYRLNPNIAHKGSERTKNTIDFAQAVKAKQESEIDDEE